MVTLKSQTENKIGGLTGWIRALMGKPVAPVRSDQQDKSFQAVPEDDSVKQDIQKFKAFVSKSLEKVSTSSGPLTAKGLATGSTLTTSVKGAFENKFIKRLVRSFLIFVFLMILVFIGVKLFRLLQEGGEAIEPKFEPTPTPASYEPYKPSIYAGDPEILQLEEDVNVLEREISRSGLREDNLIPPSLDYNVSFK